MPSRRQLEEQWDKLRRVPVLPRQKPPLVLFDRRRRIALLWELLFVAGFILFVFALLAGVR